MSKIRMQDVKRNQLSVVTLFQYLIESESGHLANLPRKGCYQAALRKVQAAHRLFDKTGKHPLLEKDHDEA